MGDKPVCLVCKVEMQPGFLTDKAGGMAVYVPRWCPGTTAAGAVFSNVPPAQRQEGVAVVAYRCPECEALRLYASSNSAE